MYAHSQEIITLTGAATVFFIIAIICFIASFCIIATQRAARFRDQLLNMINYPSDKYALIFINGNKNMGPVKYIIRYHPMFSRVFGTSKSEIAKMFAEKVRHTPFMHPEYIARAKRILETVGIAIEQNSNIHD